MRRIGFLESNVSGSGFQAMRIARELDLHITFLTRNPSLYLKHPRARDYLRDYVDEVVKCETNDPAAIIKCLGGVSRCPPLDGLITFADYYVHITAEVAKQLGLPSLAPEAARLGRNKLWAREACRQAGVPGPRFGSASTDTEAIDLAREIGLPCVVKPVDSAASVDVRLCRTLEEIEEHVQRIWARPINTRGQRRFPKVLVEELLLGYEVSVETVTWRGETAVIGVTDKILSSPPYFVELGHTFPSSLPEAMITACGRVAEQALEAIRFDFGPAHVELKITKDGPVVVEINPRLAGDRIADLIEHSLGFSLIQGDYSRGVEKVRKL